MDFKVTLYPYDENKDKVTFSSVVRVITTENGRWYQISTAYGKLYWYETDKYSIDIHA